MISGYTVGRSNIVKPGAIVGFCNPLLDMTVVGNQYLLNKYGLKKNDAILAKEEHMPLYDEILKDNNVDFTAGGLG
ncbi:Ribokinase-like [Cinara cedri]|uniref:Adenosine kinase n=1 Tax=Cinara cedri TaxID=506608 RepID=A0A5E4NT85_9HEMI|nr:Ribokinase-like [Cinara cedri]